MAWFFFFKQKTAYEMRISDWSSDVCSSDLSAAPVVCIVSGASVRLGPSLHWLVTPMRENPRFSTGSQALTSWRKICSSPRSEEHTSELQSLMRISYAVFCLKKKKTQKLNHTNNQLEDPQRQTNTVRQQ